MASTTSLFTGLTGLNAHARSLDVIGHNIANVNTTAFKSSRAVFANMFSRTLGIGSPPSAESGGTNPFQIGLGVDVAAIQRNFSGGAINPTGDGRDLAIEGRGLFIVRRDTDLLYTRAGGFRQDSDQRLVSVDGDALQGFGVDENFRIVPGPLTDLTIPLGSLTIAEATTQVRFAGNLNAAGDLPTRGARVTLGGTATSGLSLIGGATVPPSPGNVLEATSLLTEIEDPLLPGSGARLFTAGQVLELRGAEKGTGDVPAARLAIAATSTVRDLMDFLTEALGIHTGAGPNPDGGTPGASLNPATGVLTITGNTGVVNDLDIDSGDLRLLSGAGAFLREPLFATRGAAADGESVRTTFVAYDSLGTPVLVDLAMVLEGKGSSGTMWRYYVDSADDSDLSLAVATGTLQFDTRGVLQTTAPVAVLIDRVGIGPGTPLAIDLHFGGGPDTVTALADDESSIAATFQDGAPIGTLTGYSVGTDGVITGAFSNGQARTLGQVVLSTFTNPEGLVDEGANLFRVGPNSGSPRVVTPGGGGSGRLVAGALEMSNVDLSQEFINMILASTGYTASSRVIRTTDELLQQLLVLGR
jgi:flagellar hook protein FlgE